jgi:hypothetical protein
LKRVKPLAVFDLPFSRSPAMSPVHTLRPIVWWFEGIISIAGEQCHANWHNGWMSHMRATLSSGTWDDKTFIQEPASKSIEYDCPS